MKDVLIYIKTVQYESMRTGSDEIELKTEGKYFEKENSKYLRYEETELSGLLGTTTEIEIKDDTVGLKRTGEHESSMFFEKDRRFQTSIQTPAGNIPLEIMTNEVNLNLKQNPFCMDIELEYSISLKGLFEGKNRITIKATEV